LVTPLPIDAMLDGRVRKLRWSSGMRFEEHLTQIEPNQSIAWNFVFNPPQTLTAFDLQYSVTTLLNGYLALWGEMFLQYFHHAVLSVIKVRSEEAAKI
jgi:hypothetical protein